MNIKTADILFADNPNPMWIYDPGDLSIKEVNEAACEMYGYSRKEFLKLTIADLRPEEEIPKLKAEVSKKIDRFNNAGIWKHRKMSGELLLVRVLSHPISQEGRQYKLVTAQDLTDEIQNQQVLQLLLEQAYAVGRIGVWELNLESNELYWSPMVKGLLEVESDFMPDLETAIHFCKEGESREFIQKALQTAIEKGAPWDDELQIVTANGNVRWVRSKGEAEMVEGRCRRLFGIFQDIHERKEAQTQMLDALQERQRILERITEAFFAVNEDWTVTYWNNNAEEVLGMSREEVLGNNLWEVFPEAKKLKFFQEYERAIEEQIPVLFEEFYPPAGIWFEVKGYPSEDGLSVFFRDITERKQNEAQMKESLKEKETLLAEIHHRVKNNLAVVSGMLHLQASRIEDTSIKQKLNDSVIRIKTIGNIHELLYKSNSFSRLNLDDNLEKLVNEIASTYQLELVPDIHFDLQEIDLNINQAIPVSLIVNEVVTNIFKHGFDTDFKGKIWVKITQEKSAVVLQITDNGKGLPEDFNISDNTESLGLLLIDTLSQQINADYTYESEVGKTVFKLTFSKKDITGSGSGLL
ncbi:MAG: PAS domain S-box protein [Balneolaceae bacterium]